MVEPWFDPIRYAWIPGTCLGLLGGTLGPMIGVFAPKGKHRGLVVGAQVAAIGACALLFLLGIAAWFSGQPYGVWYGLGLPGLSGTIIFGALLPMTRSAYREAELRKSRAQDL
jgi:hypothetical protein